MSLSEAELAEVRDKFELRIICSERYYTERSCTCDNPQPSYSSRQCNCASYRDKIIVKQIPDSFSMSKVGRDGNYNDNTIMEDGPGIRVKSIRVVRKVNVIEELQECIDSVPCYRQIETIKIKGVTIPYKNQYNTLT